MTALHTEPTEVPEAESRGIYLPVLRTFRVSSPVWEAAQEKAKSESATTGGRTVSDVLRDALVDFLQDIDPLS